MNADLLRHITREGIGKLALGEEPLADRLESAHSALLVSLLEPDRWRDKALLAKAKLLSDDIRMRSKSTRALAEDYVQLALDVYRATDR